MNFHSRLTGTLPLQALSFPEVHGIPVTWLGGLPIAVIDRAHSADLMVNLALSRRGAEGPAPYITSANGQVLSMCASDDEIRALFTSADLIHADGTPMVYASRLGAAIPLPERVATTDLYHDVAARAQDRDITFYLFGATDDVIARAAERTRSLYPRLKIAGYRSGYFTAAEEGDIVAQINAAAPDILWVGMGVPAEQRFCIRNRERLDRVGLIKTSGGLFDFVSGRNRRAPRWIQSLGLEWACRMALEPRRLGRRYLTTNPHALYLLLTASGRPIHTPKP